MYNPLLIFEGDKSLPQNTAIQFYFLFILRSLRNPSIFQPIRISFAKHIENPS